MKTGLLILLSFFFTVTLPAQLSASKKVNSYEELKKEIRTELRNLDFSFLGDSVEEVTLEFPINAQNEIVVLDVLGHHPRVCDEIKEWLN